MNAPFGDGTTQAELDQFIQFFDRFLETELELFDRDIDGFNYWHYVRFNYFNTLLAHFGWIDVASPRRDTATWAKIRLVLGLARNGWTVGVHRDDRPSPFLVLSSGNKTTFQNNGRYDPIVDTWLADVSVRPTVWEPPLFWQHLNHTGDSHLFFLDDLRFLSLARAAAMVTDDEIRREAKVLTDHSGRFGKAIPESVTSRMLKSVIAIEKVCKGRIRRRLEKKGIRLIAMVNSYDPLNMLVTAIARSIGIYVTELQHGNMGRYHIGYNFGHSRSLPTLPDEILTFGQFWNETTRITQTGVRLTVTGFPYFERQLEQVRPPRSKGGREVILFLSQEALGKYLADMAVELSHMLDPARYEIRYKLHPREYENWKERYSADFQSASINVYDRTDLYTLLGESDVHIGVYSTTVMESLAFGKDLILVSSYGTHYFERLLKSGRATLARNAEDLRDIISSRSGDNPDWSGQIEYYWAPNAKNNLVARMEELLKRHG